MPVMGLETEYGISAPVDVHPTLLSAAVVDGYPGKATQVTLDANEPIGIEDNHNRFLANGARLYVDHAHPEYSGPEVRSALDAVRWDLAGDRVVLAGAAAAGERLGFPIRLFKNNTDGKGASYGCHENYLMRRGTPWEAIVRGFTPFLVSRTVVVGAGRVGLGQFSERPGFQLSQRADFFEALEGIETTIRRPIINTRDEPHAPRARYRRLHVITGDANRAQTATLLKVGTARAVLDALEAGALPEVSLSDPLAALLTFSRDTTLAATVSLEDGRSVRALDLQEAYCEAAAPFAEDGVLEAWREVLTDLGTDPLRCADRLDWVVKWQLLERYRNRDGLGWDAPRLAQIDLAYADLDPTGVFARLERAGRVRRLVTGAEISHAETEPPPGTRAAERGRLISEHVDDIVTADWTGLTRWDGRTLHRIHLPEVLPEA